MKEICKFRKMIKIFRKGDTRETNQFQTPKTRFSHQTPQSLSPYQRSRDWPQNQRFTRQTRTIQYRRGCGANLFRTCRHHFWVQASPKCQNIENFGTPRWPRHGFECWDDSYPSPYPRAWCGGDRDTQRNSRHHLPSGDTWERFVQKLQITPHHGARERYRWQTLHHRPQKAPTPPYRRDNGEWKIGGNQRNDTLTPLS